MSSIQSDDSEAPYIAPKLFPAYLRPTNITKRGFSDPREIFLGFPLNLDPIRDHYNDLLDPRRNSSWLRHDLALPYYHDTVEHFNIAGEWFSFPVTRIVYRRDRDLLKSEIMDYLLHRKIPARYPKRLSGGVVNEPMNEDNWIRMVRRFYVGLDYRDVPYIGERSTGATMQHHYLHFEDNLWMRLVVGHQDPVSLVSGGAAGLIKAVDDKVGPFWYPNVQLRASVACLRIILGPDFEFKFPYPATGDLGEELHDRFDFDNGDEEVEIDG
ncbi:hypothetical protein C8R43DRAFT_940703 [Mycena crocata]|nr:hypothetical protein C8R43DRAFT_940703 [Mycena crocata]